MFSTMETMFPVSRSFFCFFLRGQLMAHLAVKGRFADVCFFFLDLGLARLISSRWSPSSVYL